MTAQREQKKPPLDLPESFGKYQLINRIGEGGMASVYLARPKGQRRFVAIKCMRKELASRRQFVDMFVREGKLAVLLNDDTIVKTYEIGQINGVHFICMEYIAGVDLSLLLRRSRAHRARRLPVPHVIHIAARICDGLHYAHELKDGGGLPLNLVNRDVSPSNIRLSFDGQLKLLDFGIAKATSGLSSEIGVLKGKFSHMSPEQVRGLPLDHRSDFFSTAIVLHEMLTGEKLFRGSSEFQTMDNVRRAEVPPPSSANPRVPAKLDQIVLRALKRDPAERYQTAKEMSQELQEVLNGYNFSQNELRDLIRELCHEEWQRAKNLYNSRLSVEIENLPKTGSAQNEQYGEFADLETSDAARRGSKGQPLSHNTQPWMYGLLGVSVLLLIFACYLFFGRRG